MPLTDTRTVTFRAQLVGELLDFLRKSGVDCSETTEAVAGLLVELSHYEEEGRQLFPTVVLLQNLEQTMRVLQANDPLQIGSGPKGIATARLALRRCAPLCVGDWAMYLRRRGRLYDYGVFRRSPSPTAIEIHRTIVELPARIKSTVVLRQTAERAVQLVATGGRTLTVYLSSVSDSDPSPSDALDQLVRAATLDLPDSHREPAGTFLRARVGTALVHGHGALVAVLDHGTNPKVALDGDGVVLSSPIDLGAMVLSSIRAPQDTAADANTSLLAYGRLIEGMLGSDGVILVDTRAQLLGYNFFVKAAAAQTHVPGGARRRAFQHGCERMQTQGIRCMFIRSSSGSSDAETKS